MKFFLYLLVTISLAASAASQCCFSLIAQGSLNGFVGEDTSTGENRIDGTPPPPGGYCIFNATLTDSDGHLCLILSSTAQFVCGKTIDVTNDYSNVTFADNGDLLHDGSPDYFACPSPGPGNGSLYVFSDAIADSTACTSMTILTGGFNCSALGRPPSPGPSPAPTSATTATAAMAPAPSVYSCPASISDNGYVAPNLIIPVSTAAPDTAYGSQNGIATINPNVSTVFTFDIPASYTGGCALVFQFPFERNAQFSYNFSGIEQEVSSHGGLDFALLEYPANDTVTFNSLPPVQVDFGKVEVLPGNNYTIAMGPCETGQNVSYEVGSVNGVVLEYVESAVASPLGVFVVPCA